MAAIEHYMDNFACSVQIKDYTSLGYSLDGFSRQFEKISSSDIVPALETILDEESGFIHFLKNELGKLDYNNTKTVIAKVFDSLKFLLEKEELKEHLGKYETQIMGCCGEAIGKSRLDQSVKMSALGTLRALLENVDNFETNQEAVERLNRQLGSCRDKKMFAYDLEKILSALCIIAKTRPNAGFPTDAQKNGYKRDILKIFTGLLMKINDMKNTRKLSQINCRFQLKILSDFLKILDIQRHINNKECQTLYDHLKDIFEFELLLVLHKVKYNNSHNLNNDIKRDVVEILTQHNELFKDMLLLDFYYWDYELKRVLPFIGPVGKSGLKTLYDILSNSLKDDREQYNIMKEKLMLEGDKHFDLMIYAYGKLAESCKKYETERDVVVMHDNIAQRISTFFDQANEDDEKFAFIPTCLKILSDVLRFVQNPSVMHLSLPVKIAITLIKRFPDCSPLLQSEIIKTIRETIVNISQLTPILFEKFLHDAVYEGITWTCSHTLQIDEKLHRKLNKNEDIITYQSYIPLWKDLISDESGPESNKYVLERLHVKMFEEVMKNYKIFLSKLNLHTKVEENSLNNITVRVPVNDDDFRIFISLSEFYIELIELSDNCRLGNLAYEFLYEVIKNSYSDLTISAHFKVINAVFKKLDLSYWNLSENGKEKTLELVSQYISHMLDEVTKLLREPQIACMSMILSTPFSEDLIKLIPDFVERSVPVFQLALTIGTGDLDLAFDVLDTLENWVENPQNQNLEELLRKVLPHLEMYLHSTENLAEISSDLIKEQRKVIKTVTIVNDENSLENFQRRVLLLFGLIVSDIMKDYLYEKSLDTGACWHQRKELIYNLPLEDLMVEINLVKILPRTIDLAVNSGDRKTKIAACEVLHSLIVMILGSNKQNLYFDKNLCSAILKLGSETDNVCLQMFRHFALELMNCLSSKNNLTNEAATNMLETIFDGLADEHSTFDFKEFCGICLKNFINSSETTPEELEKTPVGCKMLVEKLHHFALHPAEPKRIAAAVIFNNLFQDPEKVDHEFNKYLYKLLVCFVKSLDKCNDRRIVEATQLLQRIFKVKSSLLNEDLGGDQVPDFEGNTLKSAVTWLLQQCSSLTRDRRTRCMEMVEELAPLVDDCGSVQSYMQNYLEEKGLESVHKICLRELSCVDVELSIEKLNLVTSSLDCYKWILEKDFLQFNELFLDEKRIFDVILACSRELSEYADNLPDLGLSLKELKDFNNAISESTLKIISFLKLCLDKNEQDLSFASDQFWAVNFRLIKIALLIPSTLKFNVENLINIGMLRSELRGVLNSVKSTRNYDLIGLFYTTMDVSQNDENDDLLDLIWVLQDKQDLIRYQNEVLYGCTLLHEIELLDKIEKGRDIIVLSEEKIKECFEALKNMSTSESDHADINFDSETIEYYSHFMDIYLQKGEEQQITHLLRLTLDEDCGNQFFTKFRVPIITGMLRNVPNTIIVLDRLLEENQHTDEIFLLIENLAVFAFENKQVSPQTKRELADQLILKHKDYKSLGSGSRKENSINIYKFAVKLLKDPFEVSTNIHYKSFKDWITKEFTESRCKMIDSFLPCLISSSAADSMYLSIILGDKKSESVQEMVSYFESLTKMLPITKSCELLKSIIEFSAGRCDQLFTKTTEKCLADYVGNISSDDALKSLNITFDVFNEQREQVARYDIFNKYLWLLLNYLEMKNSHREAAKRFFVMNINNVYKIIHQPFSIKGDENEQLAISKMMCFKLLGNLVSNFGKDVNSDFSKEVSKKLGLEDGMAFVKQSLECARKVRALKIENLDREIERLLNCHAYNCYLVLCTITKNKDDLIQGFVLEGKYNIWSKLVDDKEMTLPEVSQKQPKIRKEFINLRRKKDLSQTGSQPYSFLHVYDLNTSTLREDINTFDFNEKQPVSDVQPSQDNNVVEYKCTDYNDHECMQTINEFYETLVQQGIIDLSNPENKGFVKIISNSFICARSDNVKLFLYRLVINSDRVFGPFMKHMMWNVLGSVYVYLKNHNMNYLITDLLKFIIRSVNEEDFVPKEAKFVDLPQKLVDKIISQLERPELSPGMFRMYEELLKSLICCWQKSVTLSPSFILNRFDVLERKAKLVDEAKKIVVPLVSSILQFLSYRETRSKLLRQFESNPTAPSLKKILFEISKKYCFGLDNLVRQIFEALGKILDENDVEEYNLAPILHNLKNPNLLIKCIHSLCRSNKKLGKSYCELAIFASKITDESQQRRIMIHTLLVDEIPAEKMVRNLQYFHFTTLIKSLSSCAAAGLELISALATKVGPKELIPFAEVVYDFKDSENSALRKTVYEISAKILSRFHQQDDEGSQKLTQMCSRILIQGLEDSSEDLSEMVCKFWTEDYGLPDSFPFRFLKLLDMYAPEDDKHYLLFLCIAMFGLVRKSSLDERVNREKLKSEDSHTPYTIQIDGWSKSVINRTPLYVKTTASFVSQFYKCSEIRTMRNALTNESYVQSVSQTLNPTASTSRAKISEENVLETEKSCQVPEERTKDFFIKRETQKNKRRSRDLQEEVVRRKNEVSVVRTYQVGMYDDSYPDISLTHGEFVKSLVKLIMKDRTSCKNVFISLVLGLFNHYERMSRTAIEDFKQQVSSKINFILENGQNTSPIINALLELLFCYDLEYKVETVARISKLNGVTEVGILLLEKQLVQSNEENEPPAKKSRDEYFINSEENTWVQLAGLYNSLKNVDIVLSVFSKHVSGAALQEASFARIANDWKKAAICYEKAAQTEVPSIHEHCLEGMYECYSQLSNWFKIDASIKEEVTNLDTIWEQKSWITPWIFRTKLHLMLNEERDEDFSHKLEKWMKSKPLEQQIKRHFGEELAMFYIDDIPKHTKLKDCVKLSLNDLREQWMLISTLSAQLRIAKLQKLHGLSEINAFLQIFSSGKDDKESQMIQRWSQICPSASDDYSYWGTHVAYRLHFSEIFKESKESGEMIAADINHLRKLLHVAIDHKNKDVAKQNFHKLGKYFRRIDLNVIDDRANFDKAAYKKMCAELDPKNCIGYYNEAGMYVTNGISGCDKDLINDFRQLSASISLALTNVIESDPSKLDEISSSLRGDSGDVDQAKDYLVASAFDLLDKCSRESEDQDQKGQSQFIIAQYCYTQICKDKTFDINLVKKFVESTLKAMNYNVDQATRYFPCLLNETYLEIEEIRDIFVSLCKVIESWRFLSWQAQIISFLDKSVGEAVIPTMDRLIEDYPNAVIHNFKLAVDLHPELRQRPKIAEMYRKITEEKKDFWKFQDALKMVVKPNVLLAQKLKTVIKKVKAGKRADDMKTEFDAKLLAENNIRCNERYITIRMYEREIGKALEENSMKKLEAIYNKLSNLDIKARGERSLSYYSSWLANYSGCEFEVPGQYKGDRKPTPKYHAKIMRMDPNVEIFRSKCSPIKITMLGNDGKSYTFLVKSGDDLRLDQRIQQVLSFMNKTLRNDPVCKQRNLSIFTYEVIPFDTTFGLIEWINGTETLRNLVNDEDSNVGNNYVTWMREGCNCDPKNSILVYKAALRRTSKEVVAKMKQLLSKTREDSIKRTFLQLSPSLECFVSLRHTFTVSYATMCIAHWILGIGDRHLKNTLVQIKSGRPIGIDFGLAFGAGLAIGVPELMPFRLTSQILGVLKPFSEHDLLALTMVNVLKALKNDKTSLIACMNVFVNESLDWEEYISKKFVEGEDVDVNEKAEWSPKNKIEVVKRKLNGENPAQLTLFELEDNSVHSADYFKIYSDIIKGDSNSERCNAKSPLNPEEQVACLLDQATDLNILGRTYEGWEPWI